MLALLLKRISNTALIALVILNLSLWQNNSVLREKNKSLLLSKQNTCLIAQSNHQIQTIETQKKVIDIVKNTKHVDLATNIERMYNNEL